MSRLVLVMLCALSCFPAAFVGCGGDTGPALYPVTGTVTYNGTPVEGATVAFHGETATKLATGTTDSQGRFELTTNEPGDGAVAGKHTVSVSKTVTSGAASGTASMEEAMENPAGPAESKNELPAKYADPGMSQLSFTVSETETNDFDVPLTD